MKRHATAIWQGSLSDGKGTLDTQSGALSSHGYSFKSRFEDENGKSGTNPEELLAAAHAGCFAMQLSHMLAENGTPADKLDAKSVVDVQQEGEGFVIKSSKITLEGHVPGINDETFQKLATKAKEGCPLSKALASIEITLDARLV
ncbi:OsmC family protein [Notoacmeibacter sp. MSK16QG-6]|uniref:OsmC family protein n=1 Tax=Notoacmeibacter sp. MSK16QG-6 TaxID=2957982 RepID=UPI00209EA6A5|nr:OsmC family protein [Notoacmeibacter sp. MSK16QG-6]MCP1199216.1 OsmC family protein [Notoacmeibacter sp. MSK16QG-6]